MISQQQKDYPNLLLSNIKEINPFYRKRFKHPGFGEEWEKEMKKMKHVLDFDNHTRAKMLGYNSGHLLYRNVSW